MLCSWQLHQFLLFLKLLCTSGFAIFSTRFSILPCFTTAPAFRGSRSTSINVPALGKLNQLLKFFARERRFYGIIWQMSLGNVYSDFSNAEHESEVQNLVLEHAKTMRKPYRFRWIRNYGGCFALLQLSVGKSPKVFRSIRLNLLLLLTPQFV